MKKILFLLILVIIFSGCSIENTFKVEYYSGYSSSGGDRKYTTTYTVIDGDIVSCERQYSYPPSSAQRDLGDFEDNVDILDCDVENLKNGEYSVKVFTTMPLKKSERIIHFGSASSGGKILPIDEIQEKPEIKNKDVNLVFAYDLSSSACSPCKQIRIYDTLDMTVFESGVTGLKKLKISQKQLDFIKAEMQKMDFFNAEFKSGCPPQGGGEKVYFTDGTNERQVSSTCGNIYPDSVDELLRSFE